MMMMIKMAISSSSIRVWCALLPLLFAILMLHLVTEPVLCAETSYSRSDFPNPPQFVFGSGTSAYQYEGAASEDGRTPSIWDTFTHAGYSQGATGDIACDGYHKYKDDVQLIVKTGLEAYRFSISWSRLIPNGRGPVNQKGLDYYNNVINELIKHGIQPHVTLHHIDLPQVLEDEYQGWLSRSIVKDFTAYADVCFREFGDRIRHWTTVNEANIFVSGGYDLGIIPPNRCSPPFGAFNCSKGNSSTEPYIATHHILLAHASAVRLYKKKYQANQQGYIGINLYVLWPVPLTKAIEDVIAAKRYKDFLLGWYLDPLVFGDYPDIMKKNAGSRLPAFTRAESRLIKGSFDFVGLNHYNLVSVKDRSLGTNGTDYNGDAAVEYHFDPNAGSSAEYPVTPYSLQEVLEYIKNFYGNIPIYIHENGQRTRKNVTFSDQPRVEYIEGYIGSLLDALRNGSNTLGYFYWSFMDLFEIFDGYNASFGLYYVDLNDNALTRHPKLSAHWYADFLKGNMTGIHGAVEIEEKMLPSEAAFSQ